MPNYIAKISANSSTYQIGGSNFDGQWVFSTLSLLDSATIAKTTRTTYSLASYLPNDGCNYIVAFGGWGRTPSGSGSCIIRVMSGTQTYENVLMYGCRMMITEYHSTSSYICSGNLEIPIFASDRNVTIANTASNATGACGFYAIAYRKLGTNI